MATSRYMADALRAADRFDELFGFSGPDRISFAELEDNFRKIRAAANRARKSRNDTGDFPVILAIHEARAAKFEEAYAWDKKLFAKYTELASLRHRNDSESLGSVLHRLSMLAESEGVSELIEDLRAKIAELESQNK